MFAYQQIIEADYEISNRNLFTHVHEYDGLH
jgi:hypothetical protein